jgi:tetratricopeptide (TPR) repeat protein
LLTSSENESPRLWDLTIGKPIFTFKEYSKDIQSIEFSPDGTRIALKSKNTLALLDATNSTLLSSFEDSGLTMRFSRDSKRIFTTDDQGVKVWNLREEKRSPEEIAKLVAQHSPWRVIDGSLRWSPTPAILRYQEQQKIEALRTQALDKAMMLSRGRKWPEAIAAYQEILKQTVDIPRDAWASYGSALLNNRAIQDLDIATEALTKATAFIPNADAFYDLARAWALKGEKDKAFDALQKALDNGYKDKNRISIDPDLESLRSDPRFKALHP